MKGGSNVDRHPYWRSRLSGDRLRRGIACSPAGAGGASSSGGWSICLGRSAAFLDEQRQQVLMALDM